MGIGAEGYQPFVKEPSNKTVPVRASNYQSLVYVKGMQKSMGVLTVWGAIAKRCSGINAIGMA